MKLQHEFVITICVPTTRRSTYTCQPWGNRACPHRLSHSLTTMLLNKGSCTRISELTFSHRRTTPINRNRWKRIEQQWYSIRNHPYSKWSVIFYPYPRPIGSKKIIKQQKQIATERAKRSTIEKCFNSSGKSLSSASWCVPKSLGLRDSTFPIFALHQKPMKTRGIDRRVFSKYPFLSQFDRCHHHFLPYECKALT